MLTPDVASLHPGYARLSYQQNFSAYGIAVIVLQARSNRLADLKPLVPNLLIAIGSAKPRVTALVHV
jgi:hypothetical protein